METVLLTIIEAVRLGELHTPRQLEQLLRKHNRELPQAEKSAGKAFVKKKLLPYYLKTKEQDVERWKSWNVNEELEHRLIRLLQMKPRRTASGVATITVITKPWPCCSDCLYCPNDVRMPKSYLSGEPACQRAERNFFDPYLQVYSRLRALIDMGHVTDKVELIILGGTWCDYPEDYQLWFMKEVYRALNEGVENPQAANDRFAWYAECGLSVGEEELKNFSGQAQEAVNRGTISYNEAINCLYKEDKSWQKASTGQSATLQELEELQASNELANHRMVGLVVETRPDTISAGSLTLLRSMGCTKIQMGVQSLNALVLEANDRAIGLQTIQRAFALIRLFGFKIQAHYMINLLGSVPAADKEDYAHFVNDAPYVPDEIKLYPCSLVEGARLCTSYKEGSWQPYTEEELMDVLVACTLATPSYMRISRMIRDISAEDILVGNKKANLRQMVEQHIEASEDSIKEIRHREISTSEVLLEELLLKSHRYETAVSTEYFLEWTTPEGRIAGFLRLSLPTQKSVERWQNEMPIAKGDAMIREVHVYGKVARLHKQGEDAQHLGLGKQLIEEACSIAKDAGYTNMKVISAVGTRQYYRGLGFTDKGLYQQRILMQ